MQDLVVMMHVFYVDLRSVPPENAHTSFASNEFEQVTCTADYWGNGVPDMEWSLGDGRNMMANVTYRSNQSIVTTNTVDSKNSTESSVQLKSMITFRISNEFNDTDDAKNIPKHTWMSSVIYLLTS